MVTEEPCPGPDIGDGLLPKEEEDHEQVGSTSGEDLRRLRWRPLLMVLRMRAYEVTIREKGTMMTPRWPSSQRPRPCASPALANLSTGRMSQRKCGMTGRLGKGSVKMREEWVVAVDDAHEPGEAHHGYAGPPAHEGGVVQGLADGSVAVIGHGCEQAAL